jgi:alanine racemase
MSSDSFFDASLFIDLKAVQENYKILQKKLGSAECFATVKANAYGLGVSEISTALHEVGCNDFCVATLGEAFFLRKSLKSVNIYIFHGLKTSETDCFYDNNFTPILNDLEQIDIWNKFAKKKSEKLKAFLHFDTGINRLGITKSDTKKLVKNQDKYLTNLNITCLMSHLACANEIDNVRNHNQFDKFIEITKSFPKTKYSISNSSAAYLDDKYHLNIARPGAALFGINPTPYFDSNPMQNVIRLVSKIIHIKEIDENGMVGYGNLCPIKKGMRLATIPVGYADGYLRSLTNRGYVYLNGEIIPTLGKISMDMIVIDISKFKKNEIKTGDEVELIGPHINLSNLSKQAGTIPYEILTSFSARFERIYTN